MRVETREVRIGEWFTDGTVDEWLAAHAVSGVRALTDAQVAILRQITEPAPAGLFWLVQTDREYWHRAECVGLYDGWVYWRPRIAVATDGPIPGWHTREGYELTGARLGRPDYDRKCFPFNGWRFA